MTETQPFPEPVQPPSPRPTTGSMRKHMERQQRQEAILRSAEELLSQYGYLGLKMDAIAAAIGYAKGTIYQHFSSKEDMLLALAARRDQRYASWFMRAAQFDGRARECFVGCGLCDRLFRVLHPDHLEHQQLLRQKSFWEKRRRAGRKR